MNVDALFRRLRARGYFEITPATVYVDGGTETDAEGRTWHVQSPAPAIALTWAPTGQGGPRGPHRFNPFCTRTFIAPTLAEVLQQAVEATTPSRYDKEDLVAEARFRKAEAS